MKVFRHPGYINRAGMASSDTHEEDPALLRFLGLLCGLYILWCFDRRLRNTKHPVTAAHSQASTMCHLDFVVGMGQLFRRWLHPTLVW